MAVGRTKVLYLYNTSSLSYSSSEILCYSEAKYRKQPTCWLVRIWLSTLLHISAVGCYVTIKGSKETALQVLRGQAPGYSVKENRQCLE